MSPGGYGSEFSKFHPPPNLAAGFQPILSYASSSPLGLELYPSINKASDHDRVVEMDERLGMRGPHCPATLIWPSIVRIPLFANALVNIHSGFKAHRCLNVDEILGLVARELVESNLKATAVSLACCRRSFQDPILETLWETQDRLIPLLKCLPQEVWKVERKGFVSQVMAFDVTFALNHLCCKTFRRIPTQAEWDDFRKHTQRMRNLKVDASENSMTSEILLALQLRTAKEPFLPMLGTFECEKAGQTFIPFIPLFLSTRTSNVRLSFTEDTPSMAVASIISRLPTLCPRLERVGIDPLAQRDSIVTNAVSEMLLACNRGSLKTFRVDSPLTEEAQEVVCQLPNLSELWMVIQGRTRLPPVVVLPNITSIDIAYDDHLGWLQGFRGVVLEKLESVSFNCESEPIGDFLGAFESVAVTTSAQNTLSSFMFCTSRSWNPNFSALLPFKQLKELEIQFSCDDSCSSRVDDNVIVTLAQAMPKLEVVRLGGGPCRTPTGATVNGLIVLASRCPRLSKLRIHFQGNSLANVAANAAAIPLSDNEPVFPREGCALTDLEVGQIPIPRGSAVRIALSLLHIFPRIINIYHINREWGHVAGTIRDFKQTGAFVGHAGETSSYSVILNHGPSDSEKRKGRPVGRYLMRLVASNHSGYPYLRDFYT